MNEDARLAALLAKLARTLVTQPDAVSVQVLDNRRATRFEIHVAEKDRGQMIGREGATVRALRTIFDLVADKGRRHFEVEIPG